MPDEQVASLEDVFFHQRLCPVCVPRLDCHGDLAMEVRGDVALLGRVPDIRPVDQRQLDDLAARARRPARSPRLPRSCCESACSPSRAARRHRRPAPRSARSSRTAPPPAPAASSSPRDSPRTPRAVREACRGRRGPPRRAQRTVAPLFGAVSTSPSAWRTARASRMGVRLRPSSRASSSSFKRSPGSSLPSMMASRITSVATTPAFRTSGAPS